MNVVCFLRVRLFSHLKELFSHVKNQLQLFSHVKNPCRDYKT